LNENIQNAIYKHLDKHRMRCRS